MPTDAFGNEIGRPSGGSTLPGMPERDAVPEAEARATPAARPTASAPAPRPTAFPTPRSRAGGRGPAIRIVVLLAILAGAGAGVSSIFGSVRDHVDTFTRSLPAFTTPQITVPRTPTVTPAKTPPGAARSVRLLAPSGLRHALAIAGTEDGRRTTVVLVRVDATRVDVFARRPSGARTLVDVDASLHFTVADSGSAPTRGVSYSAIDVHAVDRMRRAAGLARSRVDYAAMVVDPIGGGQTWTLVSKGGGGTPHQWTADAHGRGLRKLS